MARVAFTGIGVMGLPMARRLAGGGHEVVAFDVSEEARERAADAGLGVAPSAREAARGADVAITMLPTGAHVREALFGPEGVLAALEPGRLVVDMSTIQPLGTDVIARDLAARGYRFLDASVGRTSAHAERGELLIMVGGEAADLEEARPLLALMGDPVIHCGPVGHGARAKIVNNYMSIVCNVATAESLVLAERSGLDREVAIAVMRGTTAGQGHLNTTYPAKVLAGDTTPGFMIDLAHKDLWLALELAARLRAPPTLGAAAKGAYDVARAKGRGREDWTAMLEVLRALD